MVEPSYYRVKNADETASTVYYWRTRTAGGGGD
jgi:hypothetical protein